MTNISHYEKYCSIFVKDKIDLRLPKTFTKLHFDMISMFIGHALTCFTLKGFHETSSPLMLYMKCNQDFITKGLQ